MTIPPKIERALRHVQRSHPNVVRVVYAQEDAECGGFWRFESADGKAPEFGPEIDVGLLEEAIDAAWEDRPFPATYQLPKGE